MTYLPETNPDYPAVKEGYLKMMDGLLRTQRKNGLWGQLVDDLESWDETSGSAMFTFGFVTGVRCENNMKKGITIMSALEETSKRLTRSGAQALTLGILTLLFGVTTGVLNIVNGGKLLAQRRKLR